MIDAFPTESFVAIAKQPLQVNVTLPWHSDSACHLKVSTELVAELQTEEGQDHYLLGVLAQAAFHRRGLSLQPDEVYAYAPPPVITGSFAVDEIQVFKFSVAVNLAGQLHQQIRTAPTN